MADRLWVRIVSWHLFKTHTRAGQVATVCGRRLDSGTTVVDTLPGNVKTCESCLRIVTKREDA